MQNRTISYYHPSGLLGEVRKTSLGLSFFTASRMAGTSNAKFDSLGTAQPTWYTYVSKEETLS